MTSDKSIAVLPFVNRSSDPDNEYFSDGITEEIINALTAIKGLKVIARTSSFAFKNKNIDVRKIGAQLGVKTVLEGSVRKANKQVRITAQLINVEDGTHIWAKNFDRQLDDIFALQDEVSLLIADQLRENFGHIEIADHLVEAPTQNIEAYNFYLKARYHHLKWNPNDLLLGVEYYKESIQLDPNFALPYFGAGLCCGINAAWGFSPYQEAMDAASKFLTKGLELNNHSFLGEFAQATISLWGNWDFQTAQTHLQRSIAQNNSFTDSIEALSELYTATGNFPEALVCCKKAIELNPLSPNHYYTEGMVHYLSRDFSKAINCMQAALRIDTQFALAIEMIAVCFIHTGNTIDFEDFIKQYPSLEQPEKCKALFSIIHPESGVEVNLETVRASIKQSTASLISWDIYLNVHLQNHDVALSMIANAVKNRSGQLINFKSDPFLDPLRAHTAFKDLEKQVYSNFKIIEEKSEAKTKTDSPKTIDESEIQQYLANLKQVLVGEQLYLNPSLTLKELADKVEIHPNRLSWLINERMGKNFNEFINGLRLEAFKQKALDPKNAHLTLLGIAYESGFNSKSVFNAFFKKVEGCTPKAWLKSQG